MTNTIYALVVDTKVIYVGSTSVSMKERMRTHKREARSMAHKPYYKTINEAGWDSVEIRILLECDDDRFVMERKMMDKHRDTIQNVVNCAVTREERKEQQHNLYLKQFDYHKQKSHESYERRKEDHLAMCKKWSDEHPERRREIAKASKERNKEAISARNKERINCPTCGEEVSRKSLWKHKKRKHASDN